MTIRPIIFSGPMVRALLDGRKTQTRRITPCPLAKVEVGDLLYVREAFTLTQLDTAVYRADATDEFGDRWNSIEVGDPRKEVKWRPSIHMPRVKSRLTLRVNRVFFDPIQRISEADAIAEGIEKNPCHGGNNWRDYAKQPSLGWVSPRHSFASLWDSLHTKPGETWADDPLVVALEFEVIRANVDTLKEMADG